MIRLGNPGVASSRGVEERPNLSGHCSPECRLLLLFHLLGATLRGGDRRGLSEHTVQLRTREEARRVSWCQGAGLPGCFPRPSLVRTGTAPSAPAATGTPGAPGRSSWPPGGGRSPRSCPESRSPGARLGRCRSGARCRGPRAAAASRRAPGRPHLA